MRYPLRFSHFLCRIAGPHHDQSRLSYLAVPTAELGHTADVDELACCIGLHDGVLADDQIDLPLGLLLQGGCQRFGEEQIDATMQTVAEVIRQPLVLARCAYPSTHGQESGFAKGSITTKVRAAESSCPSPIAWEACTAQIAETRTSV